MRFSDPLHSLKVLTLFEKEFFFHSGAASSDLVQNLGKIFLENASSTFGVTWGTPVDNSTLGENELNEPGTVAQQLIQHKVFSFVSKSRRAPDVPALFKFKITSVTNTYSGGYNFFDSASALWAATAEGLERYIWKNETDYFKNVRRFSEQGAQNVSFLKPSSLTDFTEKQREHLTGIFYTKANEFVFVQGYDHMINKPSYVPAQLVSVAAFNKYTKIERSEPILRHPITTGLATGKTHKDALLRGFLEVIERDAFMIYWLNELSPHQLSSETLSQFSPKIKSVLEQFSRYLLEVHVLLLTTDFNIPIICAVILDRTGKGTAVSVGAKADFSLESAVLGALVESLAVFESNRSKINHPDIQNMHMGRDERLIYWAQNGKQKEIDFFIHGKYIEINKDTIPYLQSPLSLESENISADRLHEVLEIIKKLGYGAFSVNMTNSKSNPTNLHVAFCIIPQAQPLYLDEDYPYLGGTRLHEVPKKLGLTPRTKPYLTHPHPFP